MSSKAKESQTMSRQQLIPECLAITFRRRKPPEPVESVVLRRVKSDPVPSGGPGPPDSPAESETATEDGTVVFQDFVCENQQCFWNPCLVQSVSSLDLLGYVIPDVILVSGTSYALEMVRSAWARRVLRPPRGYEIHALGDVRPVEMKMVSQTQFAPLAEALCKTLLELSTEHRTPATMEVIAASLETDFPEMVVPKADILYRSLGSLIKERKLYHTGKGYCVATAGTYRVSSSTQPQTERQMLMTNEEAIVRLHRKRNRCRSIQTDCQELTEAWKRDTSDKVLYPRSGRSPSVGSLPGGQSTQTRALERSHSLRLLSKHKEKDKLNRSNSFKMATRAFFGAREQDSKSDSENQDSNNKREKRSMFSRLFRRSQSRDEQKQEQRNRKGAKLSTFSAQFPPVEWSEADAIHMHSQGTQTLNFQMLALPKLRSSSVGRTTSQERHSAHLHSSTSSLKGDCPHHNHRCDSDPYLRSKSSSLPRRSFNATDEGPRRCSTPSSRRSSRVGSSPRHTEKRHSKVLPEFEDNFYRDTIERSPSNRYSYRDQGRYTSGKPQGSPIRTNKQLNNVEDLQRKTNAWTGHQDYNIPNTVNQKLLSPELQKHPVLSEQINSYNTDKEVLITSLSSENESSPKNSVLKREITLNDSMGLEVNVKSNKSPVKNSPEVNPEVKSPTLSPSNHISVKTTQRNNRPISITTVTSIKTSLSHGAIKDLSKSSSFADVSNKSRSNESSPTYTAKQKENLVFSPIKPKLSSKKSEAYSTGADDSGFTSISPDISSHEIP